METTQNKAMGFIEGLRTAVVAGYQDGYKRGAVLQTANAKTVSGFAAGTMPSFEGQLKEKEIEGIIAFIKSLAK